MDFSTPARVQDIARRVRHFVDTEVIPFEAEVDEHEDGIAPEALAGLRAKAKAGGLFAPQLPIELGGLGLTLEEIVPIFEAAGRSTLGPLALNCSAPDEGNMHLLNMFANPEQVERYLKPLAAGETRSAFAMTEPAPGAGSTRPCCKHGRCVMAMSGSSMDTSGSPAGQMARRFSSSWQSLIPMWRLIKGRPCSSHRLMRPV